MAPSARLGDDESAMAWIPPLNFSSLRVDSLAGAGSLDSLFASADSSPDPEVEALDELDRSYEDEVSFLQSQTFPSTGAYDGSGSPTGSTSTDPATQLEQTLGGLLGGDDGAGLSADEQLLDGALPAMPLDLYA
jgi:hypothetical protein